MRVGRISMAAERLIEGIAMTSKEVLLSEAFIFSIMGSLYE